MIKRIEIMRFEVKRIKVKSHYVSERQNYGIKKTQFGDKKSKSYQKIRPDYEIDNHTFNQEESMREK